jgi:hypothetical protein
MRAVFYPLLLIAVLLGTGTGCRKKNTDGTINIETDILRMAGMRSWQCVSAGYVTDIDSNEVRYIAYRYSDTTTLSFAIRILNDSTILFRGHTLVADSTNAGQKTIHFRTDHNNRQAYQLDIALVYFVTQDSVSLKQDSSYFYDPNTLYMNTK